LSEANLDDADLSEANLSGADLRGAALNGANLNAANLKAANLSGTSLRGASLHGANLSGTDLGEADLSWTILHGSKIDDTTQIDDRGRLVWEIVNQGVPGRDLSGTDLSTTDLSEANLSGANLSGANLFGTELIEADLREADLNGANLKGAILKGVNFSGANLEGADLSGANLRELIYDEDTKCNEKTTWGKGFRCSEEGSVIVELAETHVITDFGFSIDYPAGWLAKTQGTETAISELEEDHQRFFQGAFPVKGYQISLDHRGMEEPIDVSEITIFGVPALKAKAHNDEGWEVAYQGFIDEEVFLFGIKAPTEEALDQFAPTWTAMVESIKPVAE
jgi:uncharacterized protein YjbI with pentapeptide repeats